MSMIVNGLVALITSKVGTIIESGIEREKYKNLEKNIGFEIRSFNRKYDDTEVDSHSFQIFLEKDELVNELISAVFSSRINGKDSYDHLAKKIAQKAIDHVEAIYNQNNRKLRGHRLYYEYFDELVDTLLNIRYDLFNIKEKAFISIMGDIQNESKNEILYELKSLKSTCFSEEANNVFAEYRLKRLEEKILNYYFEEATEEIQFLKSNSNQLSVEQRSFVLYQEAVMNSFQRKYERIPSLIKKICNLDKKSKYITELEFVMVCKSGDNERFASIIEDFYECDYSDTVIDLKRAYYFCCTSERDKSRKILVDGQGMIREEFLNYDVSHIILADSYSLEGDFERAYVSFKKAYDLGGNIIYKYNYLATKYIIVSDRDLVNVNKDTISVDDAGIILDELKKIEYISKYFDFNVLVNFKCIVLHLLSFLDAEEGQNRIELELNEIRESSNYKYAEAQFYFVNQDPMKAYEIIRGIWKENVDFARLFFQTGSIIGKYDEIHKAYQKESLENHNDPLLDLIFLICSSKLKELGNYQSVYKLVVKYPNNITIVMDCIRVCLEGEANKVLDDIIEYLLSSDECEPKMFEPIIKTLFYEQKYETVLHIFKRVNEVTAEMTLHYFESGISLDEKTNEMYRKCLEWYKEGLLSKHLLMYKAKFEYELGLKICIATLKEYKKKFGGDENYYYHMTSYMLRYNSNFENHDEIKYLIDSRNGRLVQLAAIVMSKLERWEQTVELLIKSLYMSYDNLYEDILYNFSMLLFSHSSLLIKEANVVQNDTIVSLKCKETGDTIRIAIHRHPGVVENEGEVKFGCENYTASNPKVMGYLDLKMYGDTVFDGRYVIESIESMLTYYSRFCFSKLENDFPNHNLFEPIRGSVDDAKNQMISILDDRRKEVSKLINDYNFGVDFGVPITYISGKNPSDYADTIINLLESNNQNFYAGEFNQIFSGKFVLTLSSLIIMRLMNLKSVLKDNQDRFVISKGTLELIKQGMRDSQKKSKTGISYVRLGDDNQVSMYDFSEEDKKDRMLFWSDILNSLSYVEILEIELENCKIYQDLGKVVFDEDFESIDLADKHDFVLVSDDLFIRKIQKLRSNESKSVNTFGMLYSLDPTLNEMFILKILEVSKFNYLYPVDAQILFNVITVYITNEQDNLLDEGYINNLISQLVDESSKNYYIEMFREVIKLALLSKKPIALYYSLFQEHLNLTPVTDIVNDVLYHHQRN